MFLLLIILSYLLGCVSTVALLLYLYTRFVLYSPKPVVEEETEQFETFNPIPENERAQNTAVDAVNYLFQFLFQELKDSSRLRRYMMHKLNTEFNELKNSRTGKIFLQNIVIDSFSFGQKCPVFSDIRLLTQERDDFNRIKGFIAELDADYQDGFSVGLDITLVFGHKCQVEIKAKRIRGRLRLEFRREPFCHWLLVFQDEPTVDFEVKSSFATVESPQLANIITSQLRRAIKRKQTWPSYKIRYKPFFPTSKRPEPTELQSANGANLIPGKFDITIKYCDRLSMPLLITSKDKSQSVNVFLTININEKSCEEILCIEKCQWPTKEIELPRNGLKILMKEVPYMERTEILVQDIEISGTTNIDLSDIRSAMKLENVFLLKVQGQNINTLKQAQRSLKTKTTGVPVENSQSLGNQAREDKIRITLGFPILYSVLSPSIVEVGANEIVETNESFIESIDREDTISISSGTVRHRTSTGTKEALSPSTQRLQRLLQAGIEDQKPLTTTPRKESNADTISLKDSIITESPLPLTPEQSNKRVKPTNKVTPSETTLIMMHSDSLAILQAQATQKHKFEPHIDINKKFSFSVDEKQKYLNICLWSKLPLKCASPDRGRTFLLIGYASTALSELVLDAHMSFKRETQMTLNFCSAYTSKINSNVACTDDERKKRTDLMNHKGYDDNLAHGFVTINVRHEPSIEERMTVEEKRQNFLSTGPSLTDLCKKLKEKENLSEQKRYIEVIDAQHARETRPVRENEHCFEDGSFSAGVVCGCCGEKIWMKSGRRCRNCLVQIHKKCEEKFSAENRCSKEISGPQNFVEIHSPDEEKKATEIGATAIVEENDLSRNPTSFQRNVVTANSATRLGTKAAAALSVLDQKTRLSFRGFGNKNPSNENQNQKIETKRSTVSSTSNHQSSKLLSAASSAYSKLRDLKTKKPSTPPTESNAAKKNLQNVEQKLAPNISESDFRQAVSNYLTQDEDLKDLEHLIQGDAPEDANTSAKFEELGRALFDELSLDERKEKLQSELVRLQEEIQLQCQIRDEKLQEEDSLPLDENEKRKSRDRINNINQKIQALGTLTICYCSGLKSCLNEIDIRDTTRRSIKTNDDLIDDENDESLFDDPLNSPLDEEIAEQDESEFEHNEENSQLD